MGFSAAASVPRLLHERLLEVLLNVSPYVAFVVVCQLQFAVTTDDPYVTFRYAKNLLDGLGPVFNAGERVEGFSSPLHLCLSALLLKLAPTVDIMIKAKLLSALFGLAMIWQTGLLAKDSGCGRVRQRLAQLLLALNGSFALTSVNGLETTLFGLMVLICARAWLAEVKSKRGSSSALILSIAYLVRPETLVFVLVLVVCRIRLAHTGGLLPRQLWSWIIVVGSCLMTITALRFSYYGQLVPTTFYAKLIPLNEALLHGLFYLSSPFSSRYALVFDMDMTAGSILTIALAISFWSLAILGMALRRKTAAGALCTAVIVSGILFVLRSGGDWMPGWRFMIVTLPFCAIMQVSGARAVRVWFQRAARLRVLERVLIVAIWAVALLQVPRSSWASERFTMDGSQLLRSSGGTGSGWGAIQVSIAEYIRDRVPRGSYVAYSEMGYATFINMDKRFLDTRGLIDAEIARFPASTKRNTGVIDHRWFLPESPFYDVLSRKRPDLLLFIQSGLPDTVLGAYQKSAVVSGAAVYRRRATQPFL